MIISELRITKYIRQRIENKQKDHSREPCVAAYVALRMLIMHVLSSQLPFLANRNAEVAIILASESHKIGGHVALLSCPTVYSLWLIKNWRDDSIVTEYTFCLLYLWSKNRG